MSSKLSLHCLHVTVGSTNWLRRLATSVMGSLDWFLLHGSHYTFEWVANVVKELKQVFGASD